MPQKDTARRASGRPGRSSAEASPGTRSQADKVTTGPPTLFKKRSGSAGYQLAQEPFTPPNRGLYQSERSRKKRRYMHTEQSRPALDQIDVRDSDDAASDINEPRYDCAADVAYMSNDIEGNCSPLKESHIERRESEFPYNPAASVSRRLRIEEQPISDGSTPSRTLAEAGHDRRTVSARKRLVDLLAENIHSENSRPLQETDIPRASHCENPDEVTDHSSEKAIKADTPMLSRIRGSRITYARQRSFLGNPLSLTALEQRDTSASSPHPGDASLAHITNNDGNQNLVSDDDEIESRPVRSIHELRQAGDNARFRESVEVIFEDIEDPNNSLSGKCSSFAQLCTKLLEHAFVRRFSEYGFNERLVKCIADDQNILITSMALCAFRLICSNGLFSHTSLRSFWATILGMSHKLLTMTEDIINMATEGTTSLSKVVQRSFKKTLPQISSVLFNASPSPSLSPCLVTLSCIQSCISIFLKKGDDIEPLPATLTEQIVDLLITQCDNATSKASLESYELSRLSFLILESHSMLPGTSAYHHHNFSRLLFENHGKFLPFCQFDRSKQIPMLYARVILNLTNNVPSLCEEFATPDMVSDFVELATTGLSGASMNRNVDEHGSLNANILALGVLINLSEQSELSRAAFLNPASDSTSLLQLLLEHFSAGLAFVDQARSVSEVHYNVVIGYLSIVLATLCLNEEALNQIRESIRGEGLLLVLSTAEEFLKFHQKVEQDSQLFESSGERGESYYPTIENTFSRIIKYNGQDYATEIVDTAGQDEYSILNSKHFIGIHGYIIVYSVASRQSFDMVRVIRDKILNHLGADHVPLVLVGNKSDLKSEQRQVSLDEGRQLCEEFHCAFTEASARLDYNVAKAFDLMIGEIEKSQNPSQPAGGNKCAVM
ncbi:Rheb small monomeric GTPase RhbA [Aspergillus costaricaensis CBS 115574]|uniref:Rheb small monomeric GTPase RhbA n=1 Tax=Aspergillus costaricaensis CBS 115574 TaxID=1448317 RepID=A0ACD1I415_9EURO|nr:Rheb small monomeric GTPase RhbA [Aspergillus costaricaensis CBS 115574]RAK84515.1 Rheb small monomeric GTPase RhbA [Aspergillus costaricaensis CBS 115574]